MTKPITSILRFECGATLEHKQERPFSERARELGQKPRKDGRFSLCVFCNDGRERNVPIMPDGKRAPCLFGCPAKRRSGWKRERIMLCDENGEVQIDEKSGVPKMAFVVTCYPW